MAIILFLFTIKVGDDYILDVTGGCLIAIKDGMKIISKAEYYTLKGE